MIYRVTLVVTYLGWVESDLFHSTVCPVLLGQMGIWQNRLVSRARWWNIKKIKVIPTKVHDHQSHPVQIADLMIFK